MLSWPLSPPNAFRWKRIRVSHRRWGPWWTLHLALQVDHLEAAVYAPSTLDSQKRRGSRPIDRDRINVMPDPCRSAAVLVPCGE